jgi:hypothetical protein
MRIRPCSRCERADFRFDQFADFSPAQDLRSIPIPLGVERHILDEPQFEPVLPREHCQRNNLILGQSAYGNRIEANSREAGRDRGGYPLEYKLQARPPRDCLKNILVERIETDIEPVQTGGTERIRVLSQEYAIRCQRQIVDPRYFRQLGDKVWNSRSDERFSTSQPQLINA